MDKNYIMRFLDEKEQYIRTMSDIEIYEYICNTFYITDFKLARECSIEYWKKSH